MAGIKEIAFAYSNEEGEPYGLSTAAIYAELAKPLAQQAMKLVHLPVRPEGETELYELWRASLST
ncbi:hypothetical protein [Archangium lansingense]|uniref:Uncharacterized protein n=1 Tax=Archangium lansingense TaxID=2995310 RepID=A0ABT4AGA0_9BACT|nr:hypothetical protein [Archangium lansinium]MCY1080715.1 hypothetical protein [Archangium lansinium]